MFLLILISMKILKNKFNLYALDYNLTVKNILVILIYEDKIIGVLC
jgi:hypothetical protein